MGRGVKGRKFMSAFFAREIPARRGKSGDDFFTQFCNVATDDLRGSYAATKHLLDLGHRRIALFTGPATAPWAQERLEGHRRALRDAHVEPDDRLVLASGSRIEDGEKTAHQMISESLKVTAIQAVNDLVAIGAANVLVRQGLQVPGDISIVGFGNILMSEHCRVPLTTIQQPKYRLGMAAMDMMEQLLAGRTPPNQRLQPELVIRGSTARAR